MLEDMGRAQGTMVRDSFSRVFGERRGLRADQEKLSSAAPDPPFAYDTEVAERRMFLASLCETYLSAVGELGYSVDHFAETYVIWQSDDDGERSDVAQLEAERELCQADIDALMQQGVLRVAEKSAPGDLCEGRATYVCNYQKDWPPDHKARYDAWYEAERLLAP